MDILTNHIGYSASGPKKAVIQCVEGEKAEEFFVLDLKGNRVYTGTAVFAGGNILWQFSPPACWFPVLQQLYLILLH